MLRLPPPALFLLAGACLLSASCGGGGGSNRGFSNGSAVQFRSRTDVPIQGTGASDVSLADLDGDGDLDAVTANIDLRGVPTSEGVEIFRNDAGVLSSAQVLTGCVLPYDVETFDLDGDDFVDIVASCRGDGVLRVWFGDGTGIFATTPSGVVDLGGGPGGAVQAHTLDGDGDGVLDLACVEIVNSRLFFVRGLGARSFAAPQEIPLGPFSDARLSAIDVGDIDGDGDTDMVASDFSGDRMLSFLNTGSAVFVPTGAIPVASGPLTATLQDRDADGDLDLLAGHFTSTSIVIWDNQGDGSFASRRDLLSDSPVTDLILVDWNGDTQLDLLAASFTTSSVDILLADGLEYGEAFGVGVGFRVRRIQSGDLDGDGAVELVTANFEEAAISIIERDDSGDPVAPRTYPAGPFPFYFAVTDLVGSDRPEVAAALYEEGEIGFFEVSAEGELVHVGDLLVPQPLRPTFVLAFDADGDGDSDLAVTDAEGRSLAIAFNDGALPFTRITTQQTQGFFLLGVAAGDLDGDRDLDLVVASQGSNSVLVFENDGSGTFLERAPISVGSRPAAVLLADFDLDGDRDVAVSDSGDDTVTFLANDGLGGLSFRARSATNTGPTFLASTDADGDSKIDLFVSCPGSENLTRLRNQGGFTFARSDLFVGEGTNFIDLLDLDRDGDEDLLTIPKTGAGRWLLNDSIGNFVRDADLDFLSVRDVSFAAVLDLNGDRALDLLAASYASTRLTVAFGVPVN
ncbi:MAG: VCBS repeat-containing protein [Planctomycetes bacterium]|nr:VCBS repeat-containing protein [Planctomycetota bacterium]